MTKEKIHKMFIVEKESKLRRENLYDTIVAEFIKRQEAYTNSIRNVKSDHD